MVQIFFAVIFIIKYSYIYMNSRCALHNAASVWTEVGLQRIDLVKWR